MTSIIDNFASILLVVTFIVNLFLAVLVIIKSPKRKVNIVFGLLVLCIAFWNFTHLFGDIPFLTRNTEALFWCRLALVGPIFMAYLFLMFCFALYTKKFKISTKKKIYLFIPAIILLIFVPTDHNVSQAIVLESGKIHWVPGALYYWFSVYFMTYIIGGAVVLYRKFKLSKNKVEKIQTKIIFISAIVAATAGITASAILPSLGYLVVYDCGVQLAAVFTIAVAYAILRYRFLDIKVVVKKGLVYSLLLIMLFAICAFFIFFLGNLFQSVFQAGYIITASLFAFIIALIFQPLRRSLYKLLDRVYYVRKTAREIKRDVHKVVKDNTDLPKLLQKIAELIKGDLTTVDFSFLILNTKDSKYVSEFSSDKKELSILTSEYFISVLKRENKIFVREELVLQKESAANDEEKDHLSKIEEKLEKTDKELVIPLVAAEELVAIFFLGSKKNNEAYSVEDIKYLNELANEASFYIANVLLYKQAMERVLG